MIRKAGLIVGVILLAFTDVSDYSIVVPFPHAVERHGGGDEYTDIYYVTNELGQLKYLVYVVVLVNTREEEIQELYADSLWRSDMYTSLQCRPMSQPMRVSRGNATGKQSNVIFDQRETSVEVRGVLFSTTRSNRLYHIVFMIPIHGTSYEYFREAEMILDSLLL